MSHLPQQVESLPYAYDALEPHIDQETMTIHHDKHHQAYLDKYRSAIEGSEELANMSVEAVLSDLSVVPEEIKTAVKNHGGGYVNHGFFWSILKKDVALSGEIESAIVDQWGSFDKFKEEFSVAVQGVFGSGWAWLVVNSQDELEIMSTPNQDSPLSSGKRPVLGLDVWEHAYYLKYQNKRPDYVQAFFEVINWDQVNENYKKYKK